MPVILLGGCKDNGHVERITYAFVRTFVMGLKRNPLNLVEELIFEQVNTNQI